MIRNELNPRNTGTKGVGTGSRKTESDHGTTTTMLPHVSNVTVHVSTSSSREVTKEPYW